MLINDIGLTARYGAVLAWWRVQEQYAAGAMIAHTTDDFHQSLETGDLCAFVRVLIAVHPVTNYNKLMRPNSGFSKIFKHSISKC